MRTTEKVPFRPRFENEGRGKYDTIEMDYEWDEIKSSLDSRKQADRSDESKVGSGARDEPTSMAKKKDRRRRIPAAVVVILFVISLTVSAETADRFELNMQIPLPQIMSSADSGTDGIKAALKAYVKTAATAEGIVSKIEDGDLIDEAGASDTEDDTM